MENLDPIAHLIKKYQDNALDDTARAELDRWLTEDTANRSLFDRINNKEELTLELKRFYSVPVQSIRQKIAAEFAGVHETELVPVTVHRIHFLKTAWFRYAAAAILILGTGAWLFYNSYGKRTGTVAHTAVKLPDVAPGRNKAVLTLSDGRTILLDSTANGNIAEQGSTKILQTNDGALAYHAGKTAGELLYNTISTPKGGQYQVRLSDGTKIWLNAASSVRFPASFPGNERRIEVTGEAYLEVAANKSRPFYVMSSKTIVQVLGTSFNINAYDDEKKIRTTLIEGSIRVSSAGDGQLTPSSLILKPGQQATTIFSARKRQYDINEAGVNIAQVLAWKNGLFNFNDATLEEVMRQLSRWYNLEVVFEGPAPVINFYGEIGRDVSLSKVLFFLKGSGVQFRMENSNRLIIKK